MQTRSINITKRTRKRKLKDGTVREQLRYVVNYIDPQTGGRSQRFFSKRAYAESYKQQLIVDLSNGEYFAKREEVTIANITELWFSARENKLKANSMRNHNTIRAFIDGTLLVGTKEAPATKKQRSQFSITGKIPDGCRLEAMLGDIKVSELTTARIRKWYNLIEREVGAYTAKRAKMMLKSVLELGAEDYGYRPPSMPRIIERRSKTSKQILNKEEINKLLQQAKSDPIRGIYYAFPFLAGTRSSEQLALRWDDVDFEVNVIRICRTQDKQGNVEETTKTEAGRRDIPMSPTLRSMLLRHKLTCTRDNGKLRLVFPGLGRKAAWPQARQGGGGQLLYGNWRKRFWGRGLKEAGVPYVSPHSARHAFISIMQDENVPVGVVAKMVGHKDATTTLSHYTQAVSDGQDVIGRIDKAFGLMGA